jgi:hypothetical protein
MIHRPILVSLIGWTTVLIHGLLLVLVLIFWNRPSMAVLAHGGAMPLEWYKWGAVIEGAAMLTTGIGILKGLDWSRYLFVGVQIGRPLIDYVIESKIQTGPVDAVLIVAITIYLFRPAANDWFND